MDNNKQIATGKIGMNLSAHPSTLGEHEYVYALNTTYESFSGDGIVNLQKEASSILCKKMEDGFVVIKSALDINDNLVYLFLTNPSTGVSEIGYISGIQNLVKIDDIDNSGEGCDCDFKIILDKPLEEQEETEICSYTTLLNDSCNKCLKFSVTHPIRDVVIKDEKSGKVMYFTDGNESVKFIKLDKIDDYKYYKKDICDTPEILNCEQDSRCEDCDDCTQCPDCEQMEVFGKSGKLCIKATELINGGNCKQGSYYILAAYSDIEGNELSEYYSIGAPVRIFDSYNNIIEQPQLAQTTNLAIKASIENLDTKFDYYKIVVVQTTSVDGSYAAFVDNIYSTSTNEIIYTGEDNKQGITLQQIYALKTKWKTANGLVSNDGILYQYGLTQEETVNLQQIGILLSPFLKWVTGVASEDLYKNGVNDAKYGSYLRNEVYPFALKFISDDGFNIPPIVLTHRPPLPSEEAVIDNVDTQSILNYNPDCVDIGREKIWQFYNTAKVTDQPCSEGLSGDEVDLEDTVECSTEVYDGSLDSFSLTIQKPEDFTNLLEFLNGNLNEFCPSGAYPNTELCTIVSDDYSGIADCDPTDLIGDNCVVNGINSERFQFSSVGTLTETTNYKDVADYVKSDAPSFCSYYQFGFSPYNRVLDTAFDVVGIIGSLTNKRVPNSNESCATAIDISTENVNSYHLDYLVNADWTNLQETFQTGADSDLGSGIWFTSKLHKKAIWYRVDFGSNTDLLLEITKRTTCETPADSVAEHGYVRVSIFDGCPTGSDSSVSYSEVDLDVGELIELSAGDYTNSVIYIAIDSPINGFITDPSIYVGSGYVNPPCGCFDVFLREREEDSTTFDWTGINLERIQKFNITCTYVIPNVDECEVQPYAEGTFGYVESLRTYPDNKELFDASEIKVDSTKIPVIDFIEGTKTVKEHFEDIFTTSGAVDTDGNYILNADANLRCEKIRHYKMPPNGGVFWNSSGEEIAPFMINIPLPSFNKSVIFPLGVKINNTVINFFLDTAVENGLLSQERRDKIVGYEVLRGDRVLDKSIIAKGILYDMYKYTDENSKEIFYPNFPYNTLGKDVVHRQIGSENLIDHPFADSTKNNRYTFHSAETHFMRPAPELPTELEYEGYQYGNSRGSFNEVLNHPKYVILGRNAYTTATTLAIVEVALDTAITLGDAYIKAAETLRVGIVTSDANPAGAGIAFGYALTLTGALVSATYRVGRKRYEWLQAFRANGKPRNFASKYASYGWYNNLSYEHGIGNVLRGLASAHYLKAGGRYNIVENKEDSAAKINNIDRESSVYLSLGSNYFLTYSDRYRNYDNYTTNKSFASRRTASEADACNNNVEFDSNIASQYVSLKVYKPAQYGDIHNIKWLSTGYCGNLSEDNSCDIVFGGDIRISRMSLKRKLPMFTSNAMGQADRTPFAYSMYKNIGSPNYYINFDIELDESIGTTLAKAVFPDMGSEGRYDCLPSGNSISKPKDFYLKPPTKFYLHYFGIPQFLVESEINVNYRYARREAHEWFYPNGGVSDYDWWTQEKNVPIIHDNEYNYNYNYSRNFLYEKLKLLPVNYNRADWALKNNFENGVIASQPDVTETNSNDPWLNYRPSDIYEFSSSYGKLVDIKSIESNQLFVRFRNQSMLVNPADVLGDRLSVNNQRLGLGIFGQRPIEFSKTDLGFAGTQHKDFVTTEYGRVWVDALRGTVHKLLPNAKGSVEISSFKDDGSPSNMRNWFKENLPFKILKGGITGLTEYDVDNSYNGLGISMVYDSKFRRIFITKLDYKVVDEFKSKIKYENKKFYLIENDSEVSVYNTSYFEDASFTISYHLPSQSWASFFSFKPNFYIPFQHYFQTGYSSSGTSKIYSHLLTNRSYCVFGGKKYPWIIELPNKEKFYNGILNSVDYWLDSKVYLNEYDYAEKKGVGFTKAYIYNNVVNSGELRLVNDEKNSPYLRTQYPKINNTDGYREILQSEIDNKYSFNSFFNQTASDSNNVNHWIHDNNGLKSYLNRKAFSYVNKKMDRIRGDWFLTRLVSENDSRFQQIFKFMFNNSHIYR